MVRVTFLVQRIGPYHEARLRAWAALSVHLITVIEFRPADAVYAWAPVPDHGTFGRLQTHTLDQLDHALDQSQPQVVVCVGYADREISHAVSWALKRHLPLVTCSDSTHADEPRTWFKEMFKRRVIGVFDAALVAGSRAGDYLASLGLERVRQFGPWDVIDNEYFAEGANRSRANEVALRAQLKLPRHYFLCVARFVPKKNLLRLIDSYARYAAQAGDQAWSLVLSGSGVQERELRDLVGAAKLDERVHFPGFLQYSDLPAWYGLASALVLPSVSDQWGLVVNEAMAAGLPVLVSTHCGCATDLVSEGKNGFTFDPEDVQAITQSLTRTAAMEQIGRNAMGRRSREMVAAYSPATFALGLSAAVAFAHSRQKMRPSWLTGLIFGLLAKRQPIGS